MDGSLHVLELRLLLYVLVVIRCPTTITLD
jgi:hypothetical protein